MLTQNQSFRERCCHIVYLYRYKCKLIDLKIEALGFLKGAEVQAQGPDEESCAVATPVTSGR